ncbi:hypothetical protein EMCRGX_G017996 [Ephydatia muelleri]
MGSEKVLFKVINKYSLEKRPLFFFSDPPHLLKTTRNCLASKARHLWCNGSDILFQHITDMYYRDREKSMGLLLLPKIKLEHIQLTPFSRMRVDFAAQLLSETVAKALVLSGDPAVQETAKFVTMFDKFLMLLMYPTTPQRGATSDNPNVSEFQKNMQTICIVDTMCRPSVRGNCREVKNQHPIDPNENTPLLKRKSKRKKSKKAKQHD